MTLLEEKRTLLGASPPPRHSRRWLWLLLASAIVLRCVWHSGPWLPSHPSPSLRYSYPPQRTHDALARAAWASLAGALQDARPSVASVALGSIRGVSLEEAEGSSDIVDAIRLSPEDLASLQASHARFVDSIESNAMSTVYHPDEQGIVVAADYSTLPAVLVALRLLRRTGSILPVEVFLSSRDDYDRHLCERVLPKLRATCKVLDDYLAAVPLPALPQQGGRVVEAHEPLHKYLAVFFSTYDHVLFLDASTLVYNNPDSILREEPFLSSGLVLWPDFWRSSVSPHMASIQGAGATAVGDDIRTVELGQFALSKAGQSSALLLSIYYACFGPHLYDELQMQTSGGERGSQAIRAASQFFESPHYLVRRPVQAVGYPDADAKDRFRGVAMLQTFPADDYHRLPLESHRPVFIKANNPTMNAATVMDAGVTHFHASIAPAAHRMWEWFSARHLSNGWRDTDPERALWEEMARVACTDSQHIRAWPSEGTTQCDAITAYREEIGFGSM